MKEMKGNLFEVDAEAICITTNGYVKKDGRAVMGKGCAQQAAFINKDLPNILGMKLQGGGNHVYLLDHKPADTSLVSFPVKPKEIIYYHMADVVSHMQGKYELRDKVPGWAATADIDLIARSAHELVELTNQYGWKDVVVPRPGCGAGELDWNKVKPVLDKILDDRFRIITFK